jgi:hypothetical protein
LPMSISWSVSPMSFSSCWNIFYMFTYMFICLSSISLTTMKAPWE